MSNIIKKFIYNKFNANKAKPSKDPNERVTQTILTYDLRDWAPKNPNPNSTNIIYIHNVTGYRCLYDDRDSKHPMSQKAWRRLSYKLFMEDELRRQRSNQ